jgi:endonuclease IV
VEKNKKKKSKVQKSKVAKQNDLNIGCTIGSDFKNSQIKSLIDDGITHFQIMALFDRDGNYQTPSKILLNLIKPCEISLHMPFYFHIAQTPHATAKKRFKELDKFWRESKNETFVICHCKGIHLPKMETVSKIAMNSKIYSDLCPNLTILLENDAGGKDNPAPTIKSICLAKNMVNRAKAMVSVCLDTEHAYASGDTISDVDYSDISMVHLNAIPKYVSYGGHLDRHSLTPLSESKNGTGFVKKIINSINPGTPLVLERTSVEIIKKDLKLLKAMK